MRLFVNKRQNDQINAITLVSIFSLFLLLFFGCHGTDPDITPTPSPTPTPTLTPTPTPTPTLTPTPTPTPIPTTLKLVSIHHSVGEDLLATAVGNLRQILNNNHYYVTDTNYGWGPADLDTVDSNTIGDHTDIGHWYNWFLGPHRDTYMAPLYTNTHLTDSAGVNSITNPGGENVIVMFKSCFTNGQTLSGNPDDPPLAVGVVNPLRGQGTGDAATYSVTNIKGLYRDLLTYFAAHQNKLFILFTTPPSSSTSVDADTAARLRGISDWLVDHWLETYPHLNVAVFDYYNVLTPGGHHRYQGGVVQHIPGTSNFSAYSTAPGNDHPTAAGQQKAAGEFITLLDYYVSRWPH